MASSVVEPVDVFEGGELDVLEARAPGTQTFSIEPPQRRTLGLTRR